MISLLMLVLGLLLSLLLIVSMMLLIPGAAGEHFASTNHDDKHFVAPKIGSPEERTHIENTL